VAYFNILLIILNIAPIKINPDTIFSKILKRAPAFLDTGLYNKK
jgi:hypothetical protein